MQKQVYLIIVVFQISAKDMISKELTKQTYLIAMIKVKPYFYVLQIETL